MWEMFELQYFSCRRRPKGRPRKAPTGEDGASDGEVGADGEAPVEKPKKPRRYEEYKACYNR